MLPGYHPGLMVGLRLVLNTAAVGAVALMSAWVAHICLRRRSDLITIVINLSFWIVPVALLVAATGQPWRSVGLGTALVFVLQRLHWLKWKYTSDTWTVADIRMFLDRANWFVVRLYPFIAGFGAACVVGLAFSWLLVPEAPPLPQPARLGALALATGLIAFDVHFRHYHAFDPFGFNTYGHFANLLFSTSSLSYRPPTIVGDSQHFLENAARLPIRAPRSPSRTPDIVVWLQESATDPRIFDVPGASLPALAMYEPDARTRESAMASSADVGRQYLVERVRPADRADPQGLRRGRPGSLLHGDSEPALQPAEAAPAPRVSLHRPVPRGQELLQRSSRRTRIWASMKS